MVLGYYEFKVGIADEGMPLKIFLRRQCGLSARSMTVIKHHGGSIVVGGTEQKAHDILHSGDIVSVSLPREHNEIIPVEGSLDILYEDDYLLIVNKPAAMPVHPTKVHQLDTLANIVSCYQRSRGEDYTFRVLNRLDKDTSGCVMIAKDRIAYSLIQPTVQKIYLAICEGEITESGTITAPIDLENSSKIKRCVCENGDFAVTHYEPIRYSNGHTLCRLWLETGRTHQIRCHMSYLGHPLAGDDMYGGSLKKINRQALHCYSMTFHHPINKEMTSVFAELPLELMKIVT